jgi:hypothetical protein
LEGIEILKNIKRKEQEVGGRRERERGRERVKEL